jgi:3-dehydroquinate synthase
MMQLSAKSHLGEYPVLIASGLTDRLGEYLGPYAIGRKLIVVTDAEVWNHHGERFRRACQPLEVRAIYLQPGESNKRWAGAALLLDELLRAGVRRDTTIIAFGGGVVGDLTGFVASVLHRGCAFVQIPTTLLAQADSSVGGKTGINTNRGKNQVGTFHAPAAAFVDPLLLRTLPERQLRSGYAEILKMALIGDRDFFVWLETNVRRCLLHDKDCLTHAIASAIAGKLRLVSDDELDRGGTRMLLNFGHTFGHAIEAELQFSVPHGEAVAVGMALAFELSQELGYCAAQDVGSVRHHLGEAGLPSTLQALGLRGSGLSRHFGADKKIQKGAPQFIMTRGIGAGFVDHELTVGRVAEFLDRQC